LPPLSTLTLTPSPFRWSSSFSPAAAEIAARTAAKHNFSTPLDEIDAAARVLDPVFGPVCDAQDAGKDVATIP
jgi:hypothetical protein